eukprot:2435071-Amphidinium_carterae.1
MFNHRKAVARDIGMQLITTEPRTSRNPNSNFKPMLTRLDFLPDSDTNKWKEPKPRPKESPVAHLDNWSNLALLGAVG